jgi:hypothetical protein
MSAAIDCWMKSSLSCCGGDFNCAWLVVYLELVDCGVRGVSDGACDITFLMGEAGRGTLAATPGEGGTAPADELGRLGGDRSLGKGGGGMLGAARTVRRLEFSSPSREADCLVGD